MQSWTRPQDHPIRSLVTLFVGWKVLLLLVAACSPGLGYDTSASLFYGGPDQDNQLPLVLRYIVGKLTRWDAIYFVKASHRGYLFEQEWAFGWGFTRLIALCAGGMEESHSLRARLTEHRLEETRSVRLCGIGGISRHMHRPCLSSALSPGSVQPDSKTILQLPCHVCFQSGCISHHLPSRNLPVFSLC